MRTMHLTIGNREYEVSESGYIRRLAFAFVTPTGGHAIKPEIELKPTITRHGYMRLCLPTGHKFLHRIIWESFNGQVPFGMDIDHINGNRLDNRLANLRVATRTENALNRQCANRNSKTGVRGVYFHKSSGCWCFSIAGKIIKSSRDMSLVLCLAKQHYG